MDGDVRLCDDCGQTWGADSLEIVHVPPRGLMRLCVTCVERMVRCPHDETVMKLCVICYARRYPPFGRPEIAANSDAWTPPGPADWEQWAPLVGQAGGFSSASRSAIARSWPA